MTGFRAALSGCWLGRIDLRDWCLRWIYAQHNARVIIDFEDRMTAVIYEATGGHMSKPYYDEDVMLGFIREHHAREFDAGYNEGRSDLAAELGIDGPS